LSQPLDLSEGEWEVAVKKIIYQNSFMNIGDGVSFSVKTMHKYHIVPNRFGPRPLHEVFKGIWISTAKTKDGSFWVTLQITTSIYRNFHYKLYVGEDKKAEKLLLSKAVKPHQFLYRQYRRKFEYNAVTKSGVLPKNAKYWSIHFSWDFNSRHVIPPGNYGIISDLLETINNLNVENVKFSVENDLVRVSLSGIHDKIITFNNDLHLVLGFKENKIFKSTIAQFPPQLNMGRFVFFINSNIVENTRFGNINLPLLDVVNIPHWEYGEFVSVDVDNPLYHPVSVKHINEIEILLTAENGLPIKFDNRGGNAKTLIILHFMEINTRVST